MGKNHIGEIEPAESDRVESSPQSRFTVFLVSVMVVFSSLFGSVNLFGTTILPATNIVTYPDGRPAAKYRLDAQDAGVIFKHGAGPGQCDYLGARDVWVWENQGTYFMHYDGAGLKGWLACLATSRNLTNWTTHGPVLNFGASNEPDSASASYGTTYFDKGVWHMFYLATRNASHAPDFIPSVPYTTMKARSDSPWGPWKKQPEIKTISCRPGTYYSVEASPSQIIKQGDEYMMFFSAASTDTGRFLRTLAIARTKNLDGAWTVDPQPMVPASEQVENSSAYFEPASRTWFLFTNHVGIENGNEFTDTIWVYWTKDLNHWNPAHKAVVLDGKNCKWSWKCIGLPSVVKDGHRLAVFYDAPGGNSTSHMNRDVGLAWLNLPLKISAVIDSAAN